MTGKDPLFEPCDCERDQMATHKIAIIDPSGNCETVADCCPLCVLEALASSDIAAVTRDGLLAAAGCPDA